MRTLKVFTVLAIILCTFSCIYASKHGDLKQMIIVTFIIGLKLFSIYQYLKGEEEMKEFEKMNRKREMESTCLWMKKRFNNS